jgi:hypothetical protein
MRMRRARMARPLDASNMLLSKLAPTTTGTVALRMGVAGAPPPPPVTVSVTATLGLPQAVRQARTR